MTLTRSRGSGPAPVLLALFDAPWAPLYVAAIFVFHPWLGYMAIAGGFVLTGLSWMNQRSTEGPLGASTLASLAAERQADNLKSEAELVQALGMSAAAYERLRLCRDRALVQGIAASDLTGRYAVLTRTVRLFLQSAMLGLAAWLVLRAELSAGAMIAASVLMGRALQPVEQAVAQWGVVTRAGQARTRLSGLLERSPPITDCP